MPFFVLRLTTSLSFNIISERYCVSFPIIILESSALNAFTSPFTVNFVERLSMSGKIFSSTVLVFNITTVSSIETTSSKKISSPSVRVKLFSSTSTSKFSNVGISTLIAIRASISKEMPYSLNSFSISEKSTLFK